MERTLNTPCGWKGCWVYGRFPMIEYLFTVCTLRHKSASTEICTQRCPLRRSGREETRLRIRLRTLFSCSPRSSARAKEVTSALCTQMRGPPPAIALTLNHNHKILALGRHLYRQWRTCFEKTTCRFCSWKPTNISSRVVCSDVQCKYRCLPSPIR